MLRLRATGYCAILFLLIICAGGCIQVNNHPDEESDPHFQRGRNLVNSQNFKQAADEFERALEDNPRSADAHFELGWLYDTKLNDYAAAIYHYDRHLELQPDSERAALIKQRIRGCKQELANSEFLLPSSRDLQMQVDRLAAENQRLKQQLQAFENQPAAGVAVAQNRVEPVRYAAATVAARPRMHIVKAHETITSIAVQYGLKTSAVLAANPQTDPKRLRIGQNVNLP